MSDQVRELIAMTWIAAPPAAFCLLGSAYYAVTSEVWAAVGGLAALWLVVPLFVLDERRRSVGGEPA
ncbi:hypothetical protein HPS36_02020 [Halorubrum salinarum]|uniref:Uncharacterized protein n=1 Tax=Halorubrum salinarum TaxID=2739057 RepID=A0A7D4CR37_9EURY|nr:hypothetical protein [Halorubrum salinarum]QKG91679.1 hypothetical protein HPS36_02020 [Halorubrum salinarum]